RCARTLTHSYIWNPWSDGVLEFKNESMDGLTFNAMKTAAERNNCIRSRVQLFLQRTPHEFYDLVKDPFERNNLFESSQECDELSRLRSLLAEHMRSTQDPLLAHPLFKSSSSLRS